MSDLVERRLKTVRDHMALEVTHDWDAVLETFDHPRYELYGSGQIFDGADAVRRYFEMSRIPFPDQDNEIISIAHDDEQNVVLVEFWLFGTHTGPLKIGGKVHEPTGRKFRIRIAATFEFAPGSDKILCERPYFDSGAVARALELG